MERFFAATWRRWGELPPVTTLVQENHESHIAQVDEEVPRSGRSIGKFNLPVRFPRVNRILKKTPHFDIIFSKLHFHLRIERDRH
jgi:hypothetical protein